MAFTGSFNYLHPDVKGHGSGAGIYWRDGTTGQIKFLAFGTPNANKQLGVGADGNPTLLSPATFSLADDAVTFAKMQNITTATLIGRNTAGSGDPEEITMAVLKAMLGLGTAAYLTAGTGANNLLQLDANGLVPALNIPSMAIGDPRTVATNAAKLAITGARAGETVVRVTADETRGGRSSSYALMTLPAATEANWVLLSDEQVDGADVVSGTINADRLGANGGAGKILSYAGWITPAAGKDPLSVVTASGNLAVNSRVYVNGTSRLAMALPTTASVGDSIELVDIGGNGWRVTQATNQRIFLPDGSATTLSSTGYLQNPLGDGITTPLSKYAKAHLECIGTNNTWLVTDCSAVLEWI